MPTFSGVNHVALSVTDLERSTRFYSEVLGLVVALDLGHGRVLLDRASGFSVALLRHPGNDGGSFSEQRTGLDHLGLAARDRDDLLAWQEHLEALGVEHSPLADTELGHHLNFRDPDGVALELQAPNDVYRGLVAQLASGDVPDEVLRDRAAQILGPGVVARA